MWNNTKDWVIDAMCLKSVSILVEWILKQTNCNQKLLLMKLMIWNQLQLFKYNKICRKIALLIWDWSKSKSQIQIKMSKNNFKKKWKKKQKKKISN